MALFVFLAFLVVPLVELWVVWQVGDLIGLPITLVVLLGISVAGAWLVKREGRSAWKRLREAFGQARIPAVEVTDGALVLVGGTLLLTPGFLTDALGLSLLLPFTRAGINRAVRSQLRRRFGLGPAKRPRPVSRPGPRATGRRGGNTGSDGDGVIDVEVVSIERTPPEA